MTFMNRVRCVWTGLKGGTGLTTFYMADARLNVQPISNFFLSIMANIPTGIQVTVPALGDKINDIDGALSGSWAGTGGSTNTATGSNTNYSGASGILVDWKTNTIHQGRRIQGRTYLVPAISSIYQSDGSILEAKRTEILSNALTLISGMGSDLLVWSRPYPGRVEQPGPPVRPARPPHDGASGAVVSATVPDIAAVMRSRRE